MIELPEARRIAGQINNTIVGKRIAGVVSEQTPHKLAWYYGDRSKYPELLKGQVIGEATSYGGLVEIVAGNARILLGEGLSIRFHEKGESRPSKHQLLIEFNGGSALSGAVQMYGGMGAFLEGELENIYYKVAKEKPSPFSKEFDDEYFHSITSKPDAQKLSLKGLLATGQRIPGLGNGVIQDILFNAKMHPKRKANTLSKKENAALFKALKSTLSDMEAQGGRDTEQDLFGRPGGYRTILSKKTVNTPCPSCGTSIIKEAYMGGSIYYCSRCQQL
jgi:formamidopyrimidine-DNA glycosylase